MHPFRRSCYQISRPLFKARFLEYLLALALFPLLGFDFDEMSLALEYDAQIRDSGQHAHALELRDHPVLDFRGQVGNELGVGYREKKNRPGASRLSSSTICSWIADSDGVGGKLRLWLVIVFPYLDLVQYRVTKHLRTPEFVSALERVYAFDLGPREQ